MNGLAVAVRSLLKRHEGLWFGWSGTVSSDEDIATKTVQHGGMSYAVTDLAEADYQEYYNGFVAKEYIAAQNPEDPGVLILSRFAGAASECTAALLVNPYDPESVAGAIAQALTMPIEERRARHQALLAAVCNYDVDRWQQEFLSALRGDNEVKSEFPAADTMTNRRRTRPKSAVLTAVAARVHPVR